MVTPLQEAIFKELDKYTDTEVMREKAQEIADTVAERDDIASCSRTYVLKMIRRREDSSAKVQIKVEPFEEPEEEELEIPDVSSDEQPDWTEKFDEEEEPEPEPDEEEKLTADMPLDQILTDKNVEMLISVPFRMAADLTGWDGAELTADEKKRLTPMARVIMVKYLPDLLALYFVEIVFVLVVGEIVVSKYRAYNQFSSEQESKKKAQEKVAKQAEIEENRRLEQEEAARKAAETPPAPEEEPPPRTKAEAGTPSWDKPGGLGG